MKTASFVRWNGSAFLPDRSRVAFDLRVLDDDQGDRAAQQRIYESLGQSLASGETDVSQRHNEHQP
jgi:hypothetical protein